MHRQHKLQRALGRTVVVFVTARAGAVGCKAPRLPEEVTSPSFPPLQCLKFHSGAEVVGGPGLQAAFLESCCC